MLTANNQGGFRFGSSSLVNNGTLDALGSVPMGASQSIQIGSAQFTNAGLVEETNGGQIDIFDYPGVTASSLTNEASGTITGNTGALDLSVDIDNEGLISTDLTTVELSDNNVINTGTISINGGSIFLSGSLAVADLGNFGNFQLSGGASLFLGASTPSGQTLMRRRTLGPLVQPA